MRKMNKLYIYFWSNRLLEGSHEMVTIMKQNWFFNYLLYSESSKRQFFPPCIEHWGRWSGSQNVILGFVVQWIVCRFRYKIRKARRGMLEVVVSRWIGSVGITWDPQWYKFSFNLRTFMHCLCQKLEGRAHGVPCAGASVLCDVIHSLDTFTWHGFFL